MRGLSKAKSAQIDKLGMQLPPYKGGRAKGQGDANRRLDLPPNENAKKSPEFTKNKLGKISTTNIKKGSIPEETTFQQFQEKCWKGYEKKGMKTMFGKRYPNCVKKTKSEEVEVDTSSNIQEKHDTPKNVKKIGKELDAAVKMHKSQAKRLRKAGIVESDWRSELNYVEEEKKIKKKMQQGVKNTKEFNPNETINLSGAGSGIDKKIKKEEFVAEEESAPNNEQQSRKKNEPKLTPIKKILDKVKNDIADKATKHKIKQDNPDPEPFTEGKSPAWQRKAGKNPSGGLNAKGVASYRAANPGSKLKTAVTTKPSKLKKGSKAANRRKSFCARMKGMKKRLTSAKTARDPNSRINKSLRKWNC